MEERSYLAQLRMRKHWSLQRAAVRIGVSANTLNRWELGKQTPHGYNVQRLCEVYHVSAEDLGFSGNTDTFVSSVIPIGSTSPMSMFLARDLSMRLFTLASTPHRNFADVQGKVSLILEEFDAMKIDLLTRREALCRLAALSLLSFSSSSSSKASRSFGEILTQQAAILAACQELGRGKEASDLVLAFEGASASLHTLQPLIQDASRYRTAAAMLASQATRLQTGLARHLEGATQAISYGKQATIYGKASNDISEYLTALLSLAWTYYYTPLYERQALQTAEQAVSVLAEHKGTPLYIQGEVYSVQAVMQAKNGLSSDVALKKAEKYAFAGQSDTLLEVDDRLAILIDNEALALSHRGEYSQALHSWSQIIDPNTLSTKRSAMSERAHVAALNVMAMSSLKTKDKNLEYSIQLWNAGMQGTKALKSEYRFSEALITYQVMEALWSNDRRIAELRPLTVHW